MCLLGRDQSDHYCLAIDGRKRQCAAASTAGAEAFGGFEQHQASGQGNT